ncbi:MAG: SHOCT domain-containing protein [Thermoplasmata archaeon]
MMGGFYGMWIIMRFMGIIMLILGMMFIYFIIEMIRNPGKYDHSDSMAEDIAKERLARGEISEEEYRHIMQNIGK